MRALFTLAFLLTFHFLGAQNWTGNVDSDWNNSSNWSSWPLDGEDITIDPANYTGNAADPIISSNSVFNPAEVTVENGGILTISANLTTQDDVEAIGAGSEILHTAGTFSVNPGGGGRLIIATNASMTVDGGTTNVDERFIAETDAVVSIDSGSVSSGDRLLAEGGGRFIQNGGTVSTAMVFGIGGGSVANNSLYELNDGTLNASGEMELGNETGTYEPAFVQNGGSFTLNGILGWGGTAPGAGTPRVILNDGTASISGMIQNAVGSTVQMYMEVGGTSHLTFDGPSIQNIQATDSIIQNDSATWIFNNTNSIQNQGVFLAEGVTTTFSGNTSIQGSGSYQFHDVLIESGDSLQHSNPTQVQVSGDFIKDGSFTPNTNTLELNGDSLQEIKGVGTVDFYGLTAANSSSEGIELRMPATVSDHLQLDGGTVGTSDTTSLSILDNSTASSGSDTSYVEGPLRKLGDDAFVFPIGKNGRWRRLEMSAPNGTGSEHVAEYFDNPYSSLSPVNSPLSSISNFEYWDFEQVAGSSSLTIELYWEDASASGITDCNELSMGRWNGSAWEHVSSTANGTCTGTGSGYLITDSQTNDFGPFTFGFFSGVTTQNPTICQGDSFQVGDTTYTSTGSYTDVLQDASGNDSIVLTDLTVIGPDTGILQDGIELESTNPDADSYQWVDCDDEYSPISSATSASFTPSENGSYALIVTQEGCTDTSSCYTINSVGIEEQRAKEELHVYPNPFRDRIVLEGIGSREKARVELFDITGEQILSREIAPSESRETIATDLRPGVYFLRYSTSDRSETLRLIRE